MKVREKAHKELSKNTTGDGWAQAQSLKGIGYAIIYLGDVIYSFNTSEKEQEAKRRTSEEK